ncbi:MAG: lactonase family protein [Bacteroidota bacterium]
MSAKMPLLCTLLILISLLTACQAPSSEQTNSHSQTTSTDTVKQPNQALFIGTYTRKEGHVDGQAEGIYWYEMDGNTGAIQQVTLAGDVLNPSFIALHPSGQYLYAVHEHGKEPDYPTGTVSAFKIDREQKQLQFLNRQSAGGDAPCHISVSPNGQYILVANYVGGNVAMLPIESDGRLGEATALVQHEGKGQHPRQEAPHAHQVIAGPGDSLIYVCDLGIDQVRVYRPDYTTGQLQSTATYLRTASGAGPRHLAFHPTLAVIYVLNELNGTIELFYPKPGPQVAFQSISTRPEGDSRPAACADIHIHPSGQFLYASNRGEFNNIAMYKIDPSSGTLQLIGHQSTQGQTPRNFVISPDGHFLLAANQDNGSIVSFRINGETGALEETGQIAEVPTPVCLKFE